ncbi:hypothetical protein CHS0354_003382 [Potamilus streckersoni]|uniref:Uncharacterized protein n=1 Tax=Potamilus streckersoni TaxID=2493646 RepID=A0AAE0SVA7_9BIVA|nr:hypothetical protein CHS0354_003382 [Potamilus streckersoni]
MKANFCIAVIAVCITKALCSCFIGPIQMETTISGKIRKYCEYEGVKMMTGARFDTLDCLRCTCRENGLQCCGIGYKAGVKEPTSGCEMIHDGCQPLFVKSKDHTKLCET